jgi:hypothetical protein
MTQIGNEFEVQLPVNAVFHLPVLRELAAHIALLLPTGDVEDDALDDEEEVFEI